MGNTNYDVEKSIDFSSYNITYKHYVPGYKVAVPYYKYYYPGHPDYWHHYTSYHHVYISFDTGSEEEIGYEHDADTPPPTPCWNVDCHGSSYVGGNRDIFAVGVFSKAYFRNPARQSTTFTDANCYIAPIPISKAPFEVQLNSSGYIALTNASFKCSTVEKKIPVQYSWSAATVYYRKSTDSSYSSIAGTVSGTWSDVTVSTSGLSLTSGVTYYVYIRATADDGTVATTPTGTFYTTDSAAVATCVSPVGTYTNRSVTFVWSHATSYGTPQYAVDLQYSANNGGTWTNIWSHVVTTANQVTTTFNSAGVYLWRVRTYNTLNQAGAWAQASFINNIPATAPTNLRVTTKGRPTVTWVSTNQSAYQVQMLLNNEVIYDSGAVYSGQNTHFINDYSDDTRAYTVRVRVYNSLGDESAWVSTGYQQPSITDIDFSITQNEEGAAVITLNPDPIFTKFFLKRNGVLVARITDESYVDKYASGLTNYSVVAVTSDDYSDIQTKGFRVRGAKASIVDLNGARYVVNKRVNSAFEITTNNEADFNRTNFIGASTPAHYFNKMKVKSFTVTFFDDNNVVEDLLGTVVYYTDNFENGGYCFVTSYEKTDNFVKNSSGVYANEVSLTLEATDYDDSIQYPI